MMEIEPTEPDIILLKSLLDHEVAGLYPITTTSGNPLHLEVPATSYLGSPKAASASDRPRTATDMIM
jgi:hypothetical protein